jgi:hypothetical protein
MRHRAGKYNRANQSNLLVADDAGALLCGAALGIVNGLDDAIESVADTWLTRG